MKIALEGIDASGKATQAKILAERLIVRLGRARADQEKEFREIAR